MQPTVTVVVPTYNRRQTVEQAVRSVLSQTHCALRCVVVDNGSTDGTLDALRAIKDPRLHTISTGSPLGPAAARNAGLAEAHGTRWVAFLDSDDIWAPTKLERQLATLGAAPGALWAASAAVAVAGDLSVVLHALRIPAPGAGPPVLVPTTTMRALLLEDNMVPAGNSTVVAEGDVLREEHGFAEDLPTCEDWDLWARLAARSPLAYVDEPLAAYRIWPGQVSNDGRSFVRDAATVRARNYPGAGPLPRYYRARWEQETARRNLRAQRRLPAARNYMLAAWLGRAPGQLVYAASSLLVPRATERHLHVNEVAQLLPAGWQSTVVQWLTPYARQCR